MTERRRLRSHCPINFAVEMLGDKWSLLIVRDIVFWGKQTYGDFARSRERIATNILAGRLDQLEKNGIIRRVPSATDRRKDHFQLTPKGLDLIPILLQMVSWSETYDSSSDAKRAQAFVSRIREEPNHIAAEARAIVAAGSHIFARDW